jgi:hypothetical protein
MRWERPRAFSWSVIFVALAAISGMLFMMTWLGYNGATRAWRDPIPFSVALGQLPRLMLVVFVAIAMAVGLGGVRTGKSHD